ncbi:hypothetical protein PV367_32615 [Streptomyces europaeiscabiei]|uniref:Uncharacterized protein n=1 Tax=Streptomyces europaeiscabiei TaxID=146819 RepID=A0AAJ2UQA7_9ACTN|nr:hypothetical protein [Streptomyces europaeiscabiei]MDX3134426.1 hypothetical protein [Streptomyces europaeiscabiei]
MICVVLGCEISDLLIPEPGKVRRPGQQPASRRPRLARWWPRPWCPSVATVVPCRRCDRVTITMGKISEKKPAASCSGCFAWGAAARPVLPRLLYLRSTTCRRRMRRLPTTGPGR